MATVGIGKYNTLYGGVTCASIVDSASYMTTDPANEWATQYKPKKETHRVQTRRTLCSEELWN